METRLVTNQVRLASWAQIIRDRNASGLSIRAYCEQNGKVERSEVYTILLTDRSLKNVDRVGNSFKIINN